MADEDERWLYGDSNVEENENPPGKESEAAEKEEPAPSTEAAEKPVEEKSVEKESKEPGEEKNEKSEEAEKETSEGSENKEADGKENGEIGEEEEAGEEDDDDDDDSEEDNVHVIIGDINRSSPSYTNINISKRGPTIAPAPGGKSTGKFSMEDFESVGVINGVPAHEFNVDVLEEKPWRIPGADITDYFNYGFNEDTWKAYCERQKRIRIHESFTGLPMQQTGQSWQNNQGGQSNQYSNIMLGGKKAGWETGQIRVIGSGVASRRIDEDGSENQNIQVIPSNNSFSGMPPNMMIPPMEIPPPGFPPSADPYGTPASTNEYFNPEMDYFSSYEPTAADQWRDGWPSSNLVTFGQNVKPVHSHLDDSNSQDRPSKDRDKDRDRRDDRDLDRDRDRDGDRDDKDKRKDRSHRRSRSKSHERKRNKSRSRSPSHKKHKKKSKKSDRKKRSEDSE